MLQFYSLEMLKIGLVNGKWSLDRKVGNYIQEFRKILDMIPDFFIYAPEMKKRYLREEENIDGLELNTIFLCVYPIREVIFIKS